MWTWSCPAQPTLVWEHHSQKSANESILLHILGSEDFNIPPCSEKAMAHKAVDDGAPCSYEEVTDRRCKIPYVRGHSIVDVVNRLKDKGFSNVEIAKKLRLSESDVRKRLRNPSTERR